MLYEVITGIGGGLRAEGGNITINGGQVDAASLSSGAGIGGGNSSGADGSGNAGTIVITGGSVIGESSSGAGIGSGYLAQGNTGSITISRITSYNVCYTKLLRGIFSRL